MPRPIILMFLGPAEIRTLGSRIITGLVIAQYVSGFGEAGTPITERGPLGFGEVVVTLTSTET